MINYLEKTGKTEEEAIAAALRELQMERDDVSVEIVERAKSGFLGIGAQPAKIRVSWEKRLPLPQLRWTKRPIMQRCAASSAAFWSIWASRRRST